MGWLATEDGLEPGEIHGILADALEDAELVYDITVKVETPGTYTPGGGAVTVVVQEFTVRGFEDTMAESYIRGGLISTGDRAVLITQQSAIDSGLTAAVATQKMSPGLNDQVLCRGKEGSIKDVGQDPARGLWVLGVSP